MNEPIRYMAIKRRGDDGGYATTKGLKHTIVQHPIGISGDWVWTTENQARLIDIEEAMYQWRLPQLMAMIERRLEDE